MRRKIVQAGSLLSLLTLSLISTFTHTAYALDPNRCSANGDTFLGFPTWYKYLNPQVVNGYCKLDFEFPGGIAKILLAGVEIALRIGGLVAVGFVIYGGFKFILSNGEPDRAAGARQTILNAVIGLVIAILATGIVSFLREYHKVIPLLIHLAQVSVKPEEVDIPQSSLTSAGSLHTILQIVFALAGGVAFIIIIIAGLRFVLSQGDPQNVSKARNTILYALIGLVICIMAFSIVTFALDRTS